MALKNSSGGQYSRTDIAEECCDGIDLEQGGHGIRFREYRSHGVPVTRLEILSGEGERLIGKPVGSYITLNVGKLWLADRATFARTAEALAAELKGISESLCPGAESVLVAGLGNRYIASDAIGPLAVRDITVTRHIKELDPALFGSLGSATVSAIAPGVIGQTGIEAVEIIRGAAENVSPGLIIAIDALAAKSIDRLAVTVQLSDTGIAPGSGIGNARKAIDRATLGIPVISMGVPTVVDSSTLIYDMLNLAGADDIPDCVKNALDNGRSFFVTLKDADSASRENAKLIARAINLAFSVDLSE